MQSYISSKSSRSKTSGSKVSSSKSSQQSSSPPDYSKVAETEAGTVGTQSEQTVIAQKPWGAIAANVTTSSAESLTGNNRLMVQRKMTLGEAGDEYENEADRLAPRIVHQINTPAFSTSAPQPEIQGNPPKIQVQALRPTLQLKGRDSVGTISPAIASSITHAKGSSGHPLQPHLQQRLGQAMGSDFTGVRVHTDTQADGLNQALSARAFTTGHHIFFRQGHYQPQTPSGQELIAHELTHVVQQKTKQNTLQRENFNQTEPDSALRYINTQSSLETEQDIFDRLVGKVVLTRNKNVYDAPGGTQTGTLFQGSTIYIQAESRGAFQKTWKKFVSKTEGKITRKGWINTKLGDSPITAIKHRNTGRDGNHIIMPNPPATVEDIRQKMFGDCYLLAALISLVKKNPQYIQTDLFKTNPTKPSDRHTVRFYRPTKKQSDPRVSDDVQVKNTVLKVIKKRSMRSNLEENYGNRGAQDWPAVVEKAFEFWRQQPAVAKSFGDSHWSDNLKGGHGTHAAEILTGGKYREVDAFDPNKISVQDIISKADNPTDLLTAGTVPSPPEAWKKDNPGQGGATGYTGEQVWGGIVFSHEYAVIAANNESITLRNPWGRLGRVNGEVRENVAESVLPWDEFRMVFKSLSVRSV